MTADTFFKAVTLNVMRLIHDNTNILFKKLYLTESFLQNDIFLNIYVVGNLIAYNGVG